MRTLETSVSEFSVTLKSAVSPLDSMVTPEERTSETSVIEALLRTLEVDEEDTLSLFSETLNDAWTDILAVEEVESFDSVIDRLDC